MSVDISRVRFLPRNNYAWPIDQQGRVQLDADQIEAWAIQDRHWRSETFDILDRVALPVALPDSFRVDIIGGLIFVQPGRLYLDGLQPENHGVEPMVWNPILAELAGTGPVAFAEQPYRPGFDPGPLTPERHIIYLDVWQRTVTFLEDPSLIEPALGNADTTGRVQTIWQVRDLGNVGNAGCATPDGQVPGWEAATEPSAGRMSSRAHVGPPQTDPCLLPPGSGYTGLENRLYRVEIHDEEPAGTFRFKWAAHNATVATAIRSLPAGDVLRVARIAKDDVMRFNAGEWVEITDDRAEFEGVAGVVGQVQSLDDATQTITLAAALPAGLLVFDGAGPDLDQSLHPRVRRWDQAGVIRDSTGAMLIDLDAAGSEGLIPVPAPGTWVQLNDGVEVSFDLDPAGGRFHVGDYWLFTARTIGREVEALAGAPPFGIHHHYCRLAVIDQPAGGAPVVVEDCRPRPTAAVGCCTFVVQPGENIQAAIDALPDAGGCVCLKSGVHQIDASLVIERDNVSLHGESLGAIVQSRRGGTLLTVTGFGVTGVRVHEITWRHGEAGGEVPLIMIEGTDGVVMDDCRLQALARGGAIGVLAVAAENLRISGCEFEGLSIGVWLEKRGGDVTVSENRFLMAPPGGNTPVTVGILGRGLTGALTAEGNDIDQAVNGIILNDRPEGLPRSLAARSRIAGNRIQLVLPVGAGVLTWGIDVAAADTVIAHNDVTHRGGSATGIRAAGNGDLVDGNRITSLVQEGGAGAMAIVVGFVDDNAALPVERTIVTANRVEGPQHGIVAVSVSQGIIDANIVGAPGRRIGVGVMLVRCSGVAVSGNILFGPSIGVIATQGNRARIVNNTVDGGGIGLSVMTEVAPAFVGNRVTGMNGSGILAFQVGERCEIIENRVVHCGFRSGLAIGIGANVVMGELHVEANEVMNTGVTPTEGGPNALIAFGLFGDLILEARVQSNLITYSNPAFRSPLAQDRALIMRGWLEQVINLGEGTLRVGFGIQICDNKFIGAGATALVELVQLSINDRIFLRFERVQFSGNYCSHISLPFNQAVQAATVSLVGRVCTVSGNHVKALTLGFPSYHFHNMPGPFVGNVSHASNLGRLPANQFPSPETAFNMIV